MRAPILAVCILLSLGITTALRAKLVKKDVYYIGEKYNDNLEILQYDYNSDEVERIAVDKRRRLVYAVGDSRLSVFAVTRRSTLKLVHTEKLSGLEYESVQTCNGFVTAAIRKDTEDGSDDEFGLEDAIYVYKGYNKKSSRNMERIHAIHVGNGPEHHVITRDCRRIIVAIENQPAISVVTFRNSKFEDPEVKMLPFDAFSSEDEVERLLGQWFIPFDDIIFDPEWVCLNDKETMAYVSLQQNNAIAHVDLTKGQESIISVTGLGLKKTKLNIVLGLIGTVLGIVPGLIVFYLLTGWAGTEGLDGSDTPPEAKLIPGPIFSTYDPEIISCQTIKGKDYIFIGGEGVDTETTTLSLVNLEDSFPADIQDPENFGDLEIYFDFDFPELVDTDLDTLLDIIVSRGSRSFAVFSAMSGGLTLVADTGSDVERRTMNSKAYNSDPSTGDTLLEVFDSESPERGPRTEAVITKKICGGRYILMIGTAEDPGWLFVYTLDTSNLEAGFVFQQKLNGYATTNSLLDDEDLYEERMVNLRNTEGLAFLPDFRGRYSKDKLKLVTASKQTVSVELFDLRFNCRARNPSQLLRRK